MEFWHHFFNVLDDKVDQGPLGLWMQIGNFGHHHGFYLRTG